LKNVNTQALRELQRKGSEYPQPDIIELIPGQADAKAVL